MATLAEIVTRVCDDLSRPETGNGGIGNVVRRELLLAVRFYESNRLAFNERALVFTLSNTATYSFGAILANVTDVDQILSIDNVVCEINGREYPLLKWQWDDMISIDRSAPSVQGNPDAYATWNRQMVFYPTPTTLTAVCYAHVRLLPLDDSNPSNEWTNEGEELIANRAAMMVCAKKLRNPQLADIYRMATIAAWNQLHDRSVKEMSTGILRPNE